MTSWFLVLLPLFLIVGSWFSKERGCLYGLLVWTVLSVVTILVTLSRYDNKVLFVFIGATTLSALSTAFLMRVLTRFHFGVRLIAEDHQGMGCMTSVVLFLILLHLYKNVLCFLFL